MTLHLQHIYWLRLDQAVPARRNIRVGFVALKQRFVFSQQNGTTTCADLPCLIRMLKVTLSSGFESSSEDLTEIS